MKLNHEEKIDDLYKWLESFYLISRSSKIGRDFSDAVLMAKILKQLYPKLIDIHNYPPRSSFALKLDNWRTLNRKVLKKLNLSQSKKCLENLSRGVLGSIENLLYNLMVHSKIDRSIKESESDQEKNEITDNGDVMIINVSKKVGDALIQVPQKMVMFSLYEDLRETLSEKNSKISLMNQKIMHLENMLGLQDEKIQEMTSQIITYSKKDSLSMSALKIENVEISNE